MKRIILTSNLYLPNIGGIENSLKHLAKVGMNKSELTVVASNIIDGQKNHNSGMAIEDGFKVVRYNVPELNNKYIKTLFHVKSAIKTYRKLNDDKSIIIARYHFNVIFAYLSGFKDIRYLVPGVVKNQNNTKNSSHTNSVSYAVDCFLQKLAFKIASKTFVFSDSMYSQVKEICPSIKIVKVHPGVDVSRFYVSENKCFKKVRLLIVSRLVAAKGIQFAIEALKFLPVNYELIIVGEGPDKESLKEITKLHKLTDRVSFEGKTSTPELFYHSSDIFLLPSIYEPFGQTVLEASASGLPTVAFDSRLVSTATKEILNDYAFFAESLNAESYSIAIKNAFSKLKNDKSFPHAIHRYIIKRYSWEVLFDEITDA